MSRFLQRTIQIIFLVLFIILIILGKTQLWMALFVLGILASFLFGRIYCGFACSINTLLIGVAWIKRKLHIKNLKIPDAMKRPLFRYAMLGLFLATFVIVMVSGKKLPVLPILFMSGIFLTFFFHEELWHRYLCPYGSILRFPASKARYSMRIDNYKCNDCNACVRVCPAKAIEIKEDSRNIVTKDCLICLDCKRVCRQDAIDYK